jgi:hypothetical protein
MVHSFSKGMSTTDICDQLQHLLPGMFSMAQLLDWYLQQPALLGPRGNGGKYLVPLTQQLQLVMGLPEVGKWAVLLAPRLSSKEEEQQQQRLAVLKEQLTGPVRTEVRHITCGWDNVTALHLSMCVLAAFPCTNSVWRVSTSACHLFHLLMFVV